ncbi:MAG: hypothetical protein IIU01_02275, partial [Oscillospiraceae bacterium]|nr:hypothetical protein [Oscillospiraceae bacterium]
KKARIPLPSAQKKKAPAGASFVTVKKRQCRFLAKGLQPASRTHCPLLADNAHTSQAERCILPRTRRGKIRYNFFAPCAARTLRGFWGKL